MTSADAGRQVPEVAAIWAAARRLAPILAPTPLRRSIWLERIAGRPVYLKLECVQPTGSFKVRGACNKLLGGPGSTSGSQGSTSARGVVTASSGNHGAALAMAAQAAGAPVTVVVPDETPTAKIENMHARGAEVIKHGAVYDEAEQYAHRLAEQRDLDYVSAFADPDIIAGQGTVALEILAQLDQVGSVVVPVGGGGLLSGIALAIKAVSPRTKVVGVQPEASRPMYESFRAGRMVEVRHGHTLSDGTVGGIVESTLRVALAHVDSVVTVSEPDIARAIRGLVFNDHVVVEGAGALSTAAVLAGTASAALAGPVVLVLSGSNIDSDVLARILEGSDGARP